MAHKRTSQLLPVLLGSLAIVCIGGLVLAGILSHHRGPPLASASFPDGRTIQIEAVAFGTNSTIGNRSWLLEHFRPWMPDFMRDAVEPVVPQSNVKFEEPALIVWVTALDTLAGTNVDCQSLRMEIVDENGNPFGEGGGSWFGFRKFSRMAHRFPVFPRNAQNLRLRMTTLKHAMLPRARAEDKSLTREVEFANPHYTTGEAWSGHSLPQTQSVNGFEIVLKQLELRTNGEPNDPWQTKTVYWNPELEILRNGKLAEGWSDPEWKASDNLGNSGQQLGTNRAVLKFEIEAYPSATNMQGALLLAELPEVDLNSVVSNIWWNQTIRFETNVITALGVFSAGINVFKDGVYVTNPPPGLTAVSGGAPSGWVGQKKRITPIKLIEWHGHYTSTATIYIHFPFHSSKNRLAMRLKDAQGVYWPADLEPQGTPDGIFAFIPHVSSNTGPVIPELVLLPPLNAAFTVSLPLH